MVTDLKWAEREDYEDDYEYGAEDWDWEYDYYEEAVEAWEREQSVNRFKAMPRICRRCRWLDWYYFEECVHGAWPEYAYQELVERCPLFTPELWCFYHSRWLRWLWKPLIDLQYHLWRIRNWQRREQFWRMQGWRLAGEEE
jgi:hypothetical protein